MTSGFNGFGGCDTAIVRDDPWPSIFEWVEDEELGERVEG